MTMFFWNEFSVFFSEPGKMYIICDAPNNIYTRYYWLVPQTLLNFAATILCLPNSNVESNEVRVFQNSVKRTKYDLHYILLGYKKYEMYSLDVSIQPLRKKHL